METRGNPSSRHRLEIGERELVVAFKGGDAHAYAVIYRHFRPVAESICLRILGNPEDAAEAAQETMLRVFQGLPRFNGRYLLRAWVARIATNVCLDMLRRRNRRVGEVDTPDAEDLEAQDHLLARQIIDDPGEVVERMDESRRVMAKLRELPEHHRDALLMREFDGLSHEEMAMKLGMTAPQVKALLHRAKKGFRRAWETETGRASSFVFPALFAAPFRWVKRVLSPARDAVADAAAPVIHLSAQPVVAHATTAVGERAAAAAGAILVAGTIGIGASVLPSKTAPAPSPKQPVVIVAEPDVASGSPSPSTVESLVPPASATPAPAPSGSSESRAPRPRPSASPSDTPSASPEPAPSHSTPPTVQPSGTPGAVPAWGMAFIANYSSHDQCSCALTPHRTLGRSAGSAGRDMYFDEAAEGAVRDAEGDASWGFQLDYQGRVKSVGDTLTLEFNLKVGDDVYTYRASGRLEKLTEYADGWGYEFRGSFEFVGGPSGQARPIASQGALEMGLKVWSDGSLYRADIAIG